MANLVYVDNLCIYDPQFESVARSFRKEAANAGGNSIIHSVKTMEELRVALNTYAQIKFCEVILHGMPGMIHFANGGAMVGSYINTLCANPSFFQKDARILFDNCSIGAGAEGDKFMDSIGAGMLKGKGGTVGAATVDNLAFLPFGTVYM